MTYDEVGAKLDVFRDNMEKLAEIPQTTLVEFSSDFRNLDSALHRLQTSIRALIDVGGFVVSRLGLGAPTSSADILERLEEHGSLPEGSTERFTPIISFRNRVVHLYERIDPAIVYEILTEERGDLEELMTLLLAAVDRET